CRAQHFQHGFAAGDIWVKIGRQRMSWVGARTVVFVFCSLCQRKFRWLKNRLYYESSLLQLSTHLAVALCSAPGWVKSKWLRIVVYIVMFTTQLQKIAVKAAVNVKQ